MLHLPKVKSKPHCITSFFTDPYSTYIRSLSTVFRLSHISLTCVVVIVFRDHVCSVRRSVSFTSPGLSLLLLKPDSICPSYDNVRSVFRSSIALDVAKRFHISTSKSYSTEKSSSHYVRLWW